MSLSYPKLKLPDSHETIAFRTVEQMMRSDPLLSTTVKAWRSWRGERRRHPRPDIRDMSIHPN